jgi:hypothetical protein
MVVLALSSGVMATAKVAAATKPKNPGLACTPNHLRAITYPALTQTGTTGYAVALHNVSNSTCTLEGYPQLKMLDAAGKAIPTRVTHGAAFTGANAGQERRVTLITVKPGWSALFAGSYPNSTNYPPAACPISDRVEIHIPNMKEPIVVKWRIQPYGGKTGAPPHCGQVSVSYVYGPYRLTKSQLNNTP